MAFSVQVIYPAHDNTTFDFDYYATSHLGLIKSLWGDHMTSVQIIKGLPAGSETPPAFHAVATVVFERREDLTAALAAAGPLSADVPNYTNATPQMLIGEIL